MDVGAELTKRIVLAVVHDMWVGVFGGVWGMEGGTGECNVPSRPSGI